MFWHGFFIISLQIFCFIMIKTDLCLISLTLKKSNQLHNFEKQTKAFIRGFTVFYPNQEYVSDLTT